MIQNPTILASVQQQWATVRRLCRDSHRQALIPGHGYICETPPEALYNLPFLLAYAVLDQVFDELIQQGTLPRPSGRPLLGAKMSVAKTALQWQDYPLIDAGKTVRNDLAHNGTLLAKATCFTYIAAIESEFQSWGIL